MNSSYCWDELSNIQNWATANNLKLNRRKSKEIIFWAPGIRGKSVQLSPPCQSIERTDKLTVLGVVINDRMTAGCCWSCWLLAVVMFQSTVHVAHVAESWHSKKRRWRTSSEQQWWEDVYCAPAWSGFCSAADRAKIDAFLRRCKRSGYCELSVPTMANCWLMLMTHTFYVNWQTKTTSCRHSYLKDKHQLTGVVVES